MLTRYIAPTSKLVMHLKRFLLRLRTTKNVPKLASNVLLVEC